jgi:hypothetical protein
MKWNWYKRRKEQQGAYKFRQDISQHSFRGKKKKSLPLPKQTEITCQSADTELQCLSNSTTMHTTAYDSKLYSFSAYGRSGPKQKKKFQHYFKLKYFEVDTRNLKELKYF